MKLRPLSAGELAAMQATQESAMLDTCTIRSYSVGSRNAYGQPGKTYTDTAGVKCGLTLTPGAEMPLPDKTVLQVDGVLRLPLGAALSANDQVTVTARYGVTEASPITYEVVGPIRQGPTGIRVALRKTQVTQ